MIELTTNQTQSTANKQGSSVLVRELERWFARDFSIWDARIPRPVEGNGRVAATLCETAGVLRTVLESRVPVVLVDEGPLFVLAVPMGDLAGLGKSRLPPSPAALEPMDDRVALGNVLGLEPHEVQGWFDNQLAWSPNVAIRFAIAFLSTKRAERRVHQLETRLEDSVERLSTSYDELSLLHRLTNQLRLSSSDEELGESRWVDPRTHAGGGSRMHLLPAQDAAKATYQTRSQSVLLKRGGIEFSLAHAEQYIDSIDFSFSMRPHLANVSPSAPRTPLPGTRELIIAQIRDRETVFGHLIIANHRESRPFGITDATLISSVAAILGVHCGNYELYRQHAEFVASVVQALTSAIDAKDAYTCGHSDRVARIAVRLAQELGCTSDQLHTLYMAGLLHDIGKIGITDSVLQKPGSLTTDEFQHIQQHPRLGFNILADIRQLSDVLPIVLHHHEQWNGKGYPAQLQGDEIPLLARITAVADAFDAMTSNRPYRDGMPLEKVEEILRNGSGSQWDPTVIDAYFSAREDIKQIMANERENLPLDLKRW
ncbi:MAG: HD-GYP domain-containing protein [Pirellulaceae bacterium]